jgi:hypothetical protein
MNTKKRILEKINKKMDMINECLPPPVTFSEAEVIEMINEIIGLDLSKMNSKNPTQEDLNEIYNDKVINTTKYKVEEAFRNALRKKGRVIDYSNVPKGTYM